MKNAMICFFLLFTVAAKAQNFEGVIKWSMKLDITDPATKAKLENAKTQAADPDQQKKMKELQEKMNDPQMKKMMDSNPQMKAQMEAALKMIQGAGSDPSSMMPTGFVVELKGDNAHSQVEGGMMKIETLYLKDKDKTYLINREAKTYTPMSSGSQDPSANKNTAKVTKTSETAKILGYNCVRYNVETTERGKTVTQAIWTTTEIKDIDFKKYINAKSSNGTSLYHEGMEGVPLRVVASTPEGNMTMEVTEFKKQSLPDSEFAIPAGFTESKGMGLYR